MYYIIRSNYICIGYILEQKVQNIKFVTINKIYLIINENSIMCQDKQFSTSLISQRIFMNL